MLKDILNNIAYQRYATQSLYKALVEKNKRIQRMDMEKAELCDSLIINIINDINTAKSNLERITTGENRLDYITAKEDAVSAIITEMLEDITRLEKLCDAELPN